MEQPQPRQQPENPLDNAWKELSAGKKFLVVIATLCFIAVPMLTVINLGFTAENTSSNLGFMSDTTMWAVNISLGMLGGLCLAPKKMIAAIVAGGATTAAATGFMILYTSWRDTLYSIEFVIPVLLAAFIGWKIFVLLGGKPKKLVDDDWNIWTGNQG